MTTMMGQFTFSGSQNFSPDPETWQSLSGQVIFRLFPFNFQELKSARILQNQYAPHLIKGFYPGDLRPNIRPVDFYPNYIETFYSA